MSEVSLGAFIGVLQWLSEIQCIQKVVAKFHQVMGSKSFEWIFYPLDFKSRRTAFAWISPRIHGSTYNVWLFRRVIILLLADRQTFYPNWYCRMIMSIDLSIIPLTNVRILSLTVYYATSPPLCSALQLLIFIFPEEYSDPKFKMKRRYFCLEIFCQFFG